MCCGSKRLQFKSSMVQGAAPASRTNTSTPPKVESGQAAARPKTGAFPALMRAVNRGQKA